MKQQTLSRVAERLYWMGRYVERAESTARLISTNADFLIDFPLRMPQGWEALTDITGTSALFDALYDEPTEKSVVRFLVSDQRNPASIASTIDSARENARTIRETMPRLTFELINDLHLYIKDTLGGTLSRTRRVEGLRGVAYRVQQLEGFLSANMVHDTHWSFLRMGMYLERADMTTRIIDVRSVDELPEGHDDDEALMLIRWRSILRSLYAMQSFQASVQPMIERAPVLEFLFQNESLPRSYRNCLNAIRRNLRDLPRNERPLRYNNRVLRELKQVDPGELDDAALHEFIDDCQVKLNGLHDEITRTYFRLNQQKPRKRRSA